MAASTNATRVIVGTAWTKNTLLARELRASQYAEKGDGIRRVFIYDADEVRKYNPDYGVFVDKEVGKLGRDHPFIKSQYYCEEIGAEIGMFNDRRRALMQRDQEAHESPLEGTSYAFLVDSAGQDLNRMGLNNDEPLDNPERDSVALTIASIDLSTVEILKAPTYRFVHREQWKGENHLAIFGKLKNLIETWNPQHVVLDATGVGEGLWAMLDKTFPGRVIPVKFNRQTKSDIGWRYLAAIETGRVRDCCLTDRIRAQYDACQAEVMPGPGKYLRWYVPEGARGTDGELIHDDTLMADAMIAELDKLDWRPRTEPVFVEIKDDFEAMGRNF
jgi:hypothetical protein